jgi:hypothetical protein
VPSGNEKALTAENAENAEKEPWVLNPKSFSVLSAFSAVQSVTEGADGQE